MKNWNGITVGRNMNAPIVNMKAVLLGQLIYKNIKDVIRGEHTKMVYDVAMIDGVLVYLYRLTLIKDLWVLGDDMSRWRITWIGGT